MSNVYKGTATFVAPKATLEKLDTLLTHLYEFAEISGFDGSREWIGHIFKENVVTEGVFCEGCALEAGSLKVYLHCVGNPGFDTLQSIADSTASIIRYQCKDEVDDPLRPQTFMARVNNRAQWELRDVSELGAKRGNEDLTGIQVQSDLRRMSLIGTEADEDKMKPVDE